MTHISVRPIETSELRVRAALANEVMTVTFAGSADTRSMAAIDAILTRVHEEVQRVHTPEVRVDFSAFEFMNSSCFKAFVTWIGRVQELDATTRYRIRFLANGGRHWQRRSLEALRCFALDLVDVETSV